MFHSTGQPPAAALAASLVRHALAAVMAVHPPKALAAVTRAAIPGAEPVGLVATLAAARVGPVAIPGAVLVALAAARVGALAAPVAELVEQAATLGVARVATRAAELVAIRAAVVRVRSLRAMRRGRSHPLSQSPKNLMVLAPLATRKAVASV